MKTIFVGFALGVVAGAAFSGAVFAGSYFAQPIITCPLSADGEQHAATSVLPDGRVICAYIRTNAAVPKGREGKLVKAPKTGHN